MSAKKYYCILDTETVTLSRKVFDLGYKIIDRQGNVYEEGSYVVQEQVGTKDGLEELVHDNFSSNKCAIYFNDLLNNHGDFEVLPFDNIRTLVNDAIEYYNATLCAYNLAFDLNALNKTSQFYCGCDFFVEMPELLDIWNAAMSTVCDTMRYIRFVAEHAIVTDKGNPQTGAEAVYKFITQDTNFEESHTALKDCDIEAQILKACVNTHKKISREIVGCCVHNLNWQNIVNRYNEYVNN